MAKKIDRAVSAEELKAAWPSCVSYKSCVVSDVSGDEMPIEVSNAGNVSISGYFFEPENAREIGQMLIRFADTGALA